MTRPTTPASLSPFNWRGQPPQINWTGKSERQVLLDATRVNRETTVSVFVQPTQARKRRKA